MVQKKKNFIKVFQKIIFNERLKKAYETAIEFNYKQNRFLKSENTYRDVHKRLYDGNVEEIWRHRNAQQIIDNYYKFKEYNPETNCMLCEDALMEQGDQCQACGYVEQKNYFGFSPLQTA